MHDQKGVLKSRNGKGELNKKKEKRQQEKQIKGGVDIKK